jgi:RNA recognition motif-containing protein
MTEIMTQRQTLNLKAPLCSGELFMDIMESSPQQAEVEEVSNLFVSNLSHSITERDLLDHFAKFGKVSRIQIIRDPFTGVSRGFGYVFFDNAEAAEAQHSSNWTKLGGSRIRVELAKRH